MGIFDPYKVISSTTNRIHLQDRRWRQAAHLFLFRLLPVISLAGGFYLLFVVQTGIPTYMAAIYSAGILIGSILLFLKKYILEVVITPHNIEITKHVFFSSERLIYTSNEIEHIEVMMRRGKGGGLKYFATLHNGRKNMFIHIPSYYMSRQKKADINNLLQEITGLPVKPAKMKLLPTIAR